MIQNLELPDFLIKVVFPKWPSKLPNQVLVRFLANSKWLVRGPTWTLCNGDALDWVLNVWCLFRWRNLVCTKLQLTHRLRVQILKYAWPYASRKAAVAPVKSWATKRVCKQAANALDTLDTPINGKVMLQHIQHHLLAMSHAVSHAARFFSCWLVTVVNDRCDPWNQLMKSALWWTTNGEVHSLQNQG